PPTCSGDMYAGVPTGRSADDAWVLSSKTRARPKSLILTRSIPSSSRTMYPPCFPPAPSLWTARGTGDRTVRAFAPVAASDHPIPGTPAPPPAPPGPPTPPLLESFAAWLARQEAGSVGWFRLEAETIPSEWDPEVADRLRRDGFSFLHLPDGSLLA